MYKALYLLFFISMSASAKEYRLLEVEHFDMGYQEFKNIRDPYVPDTTNMKYRASTNFRLGLARTLFWDNTLHTEAVRSGTVKTVGWHWITGIRLTKKIVLFQEHHSRHVVEEYRGTKNGRNTFPVEDSYGIRITIIDLKQVNSLSDLFY